MSEYKCVRVVNKELTKDDFHKVYDTLCNLEVGIMTEDHNAIVFSGKSEIKQRFSVDCGSITTELRAFLLAVRWYLRHESGIEIEIG